MGFVSLNPSYASILPLMTIRLARCAYASLAGGNAGAVPDAEPYQRGCQVISAKIAITPAKAGQPSANQMRNKSRY